MSSTSGSAPAIETRSAALADAELLALTHIRAWQAAYLGLIPPDHLDRDELADRVTSWRQRIVKPAEGTRLLVATVEGRVSGFTSFGRARDADSGEDGEVYALNVHPDHWRAGVGSALLTAAHVSLAELGHRSAVLWVLPGNNRARRFYERWGWEPETVQRTLAIDTVAILETRYQRSVP